MTYVKTKTKPFPHQWEGLQRLQKKDQYALFCKMRTGKSKMLIDDAVARFRSGQINLIFIVCPNGIQQNWIGREVPRHCAVPWDGIAVTSTMNKSSWEKLDRLSNFEPDDQPVLKFVAVNVEQIRYNPKKPSTKFQLWLNFVKKFYTYMIIDESQIIKNPRSQATKGAHKIGPHAVVRRIASGTPQPQGPVDLWSQMRWLNGSAMPYKSFAMFRSEFCIERKIPNRGSRGPAEIPIVIGYKNHAKLKNLLHHWSYSITLEEVSDDVPSILEDVVTVEFTPDQKRIYKGLQDEAFALIEELPEDMTQEEAIEWALLNPDLARVSAQNALTVALRMLQVTGGHVTDETGEIYPIKSNRLGALLQFLESIDRNEKVVIWVNFRHELDELEAAVRMTYGDETVVTYRGGVSADDRTSAIDDFQDAEGPVRFFIANPASAGRGIDLSASRHMIWYTYPNYNYEVYQQACARQQGPNQRRRIIMTHFQSDLGRDRLILESMERKRKAEETMIYG